MVVRRRGSLCSLFCKIGVLMSFQKCEGVYLYLSDTRGGFNVIYPNVNKNTT